MDSIVFLGKGGIGKSTISSNVSLMLGYMGHNVLHVGCDPKMDSAIALSGYPILPFSSGGHELKEFIVKSPFVNRVDCVEAGGPTPGIGCAGIAISSLLDAINEEKILENGKYDRIVFDVLGDVVCGGFATPLKKGFAKKAIIITSEEDMSLYAANNLLKMINNNKKNGVSPFGIIINARNPKLIDYAQKFAEMVNVPVLGIIHRDESVYNAAHAHKPALIFDPKSQFSRQIVKICMAMSKKPDLTRMTYPLDENEFYLFTGGEEEQKKIIQDKAAKPDIEQKKDAKLTARLLKKHGFVFKGYDKENILLEFSDNSGICVAVITPKADRRPNMYSFSDWAFYIHPSYPYGSTEKLAKSLEGLSCFSYEDFMLLGAETTDNYLTSISELRGKPKRSNPPFNMQEDKYSFLLTEESFYENNIGIPTLGYSDFECCFHLKYGGMLSFYEMLQNKNSAQPILPLVGMSSYAILNVKDILSGQYNALITTMNTCSQVLDSHDNCIFKLEAGCAVKMLSEDFPGIVNDLPNKGNVSLFSRSNDAYKINFLAKELSKNKKRNVFKVCLIDYGAYAKDLFLLLKEKNISASVENQFSMQEYSDSSLQVLFFHSKIREDLFKKMEYKYIVPAMPFGFSHTFKWLESIAVALNETDGAGKIEIDAMRPNEHQTKAEQKYNSFLADCQAAFIINEEELRYLFKENQDFPASIMLFFLKQTSLKINIFVRRKNIKISETGIKNINGEYNIVPFSSAEELRKLLVNNEKIKLVYSDIRDDKRMSSLGKSAFSSNILFAGYDGAIETLRRLTELIGYSM